MDKRAFVTWLLAMCLAVEFGYIGYKIGGMYDVTSPGFYPPATPKAPHCELGITLHIVRGKVGYRDTAVVCQDWGTGGWVVVK